MINELMKQINEANEKKEALEKQIELLKGEIDNLEAYIDDGKEKLFAEMSGDFVEADGLVAQKFRKENIGYTSDKDVLDYLKANGYEQYIKTKVTESLDKNPLKKAIKTNTTLAEALDSMTVKTVTEYVVVTTVENHKKMLEHLEKGK